MSDERMIEAARIAQAEEFINTKKKNTILKLHKEEIMFLVDKNNVYQ